MKTNPDFLDGKEVISFAQKKNCKVTYGKGDHVKVEYNHSMMIIPSRDIGKGLGCKIKKWFITVGLLTLLLLVLFIVL